MERLEILGLYLSVFIVSSLNCIQAPVGYFFFLFFYTASELHTNNLYMKINYIAEDFEYACK